MRTNELHASAKQVQRSSGRSSVAAAAYRCGERIIDERTGLIHDYRQKGGVEFTRLYMPADAPEDLRERAKLWNAVEAKENRKNSCTAREFEIAFPHEFNALQRREAGDMIAKEIMRRYNVAVDIAYHHPNKDGDQRNFHAHILFTTRGFDPKTIDGWAKNKYRDFNNDKMEVDGESTTRGKAEVHSLRKFTADQMNEIAERDGLAVKTEHLSFEARGIDKQPTKKMGWLATQLERRGIRTERGDLNRAIIAANDNMGSNTARLKEQKRLLLLDQSRALLALEQEEGSEGFTGSRMARFGEGESFPFHQKKVEEAMLELQASKDRLEKITVIERLTGKKALFEADIQGKERIYLSAQRELSRINESKDIEPLDEGRVKQTLEDYELDRQRTAQLYARDREEMQALQQDLQNRSNIDKIIGAITGKTKDEQNRLEQLQANIHTYEADRRAEEIRQKQIDQLKNEKEHKALDTSRANDNEDEPLTTNRPELELSVEERKQEFLDRMNKERDEREQKESEVKKAEEPSEDQKVERSKGDNAAARKEEFLQRMKEERGADKPRDKGDRERE